MIPPTFAYHAPRSLPEALIFLQQYGGDAKVLAGGQSLIPLLKMRLAGPTAVIDLGKIAGLSTLEERDGELVIGAMVREATLERSMLVRQRYPALYDASSVVADPIVRNFATLGGNVAHADPANDHPALMLAMRASMVATGANGTRRIPADAFFVDTFETSLAPDEILTAVHIPHRMPYSGAAYVKFERKVGDYAVAAVAAYLAMSGNTIIAAGLGLTNVGPRAIRAAAAEQFLAGKQLDEATLREAARLASVAAEPVADLRGTVEYKKAMVRTLTVRALRQAQQRALEV